MVIRKHFDSGAEDLLIATSPGVTNYAARIWGNVVGFVQLVRHSTDDLPFTGHWLFSLQVWPLWRGLGIGEDLSRRVIEQAVAEGAKELFCLVRNDNYAAQNLYGKLGFESWIIPSIKEQLEKEWIAFGIRRVVLRKALL